MHNNIVPRVASFPSDASAESQRDMFANSPTQDQDFARKLSSKFLLQRFFGVCSVFAYDVFRYRRRV